MRARSSRPAHRSTASMSPSAGAPSRGRATGGFAQRRCASHAGHAQRQIGERGVPRGVAGGVGGPPAFAALPPNNSACSTAAGSSGCVGGNVAGAHQQRRRRAAVASSRGQPADSPALRQGVALAMEASRAKQAASCDSQPGAGIASLASTATSTSPQAPQRLVQVLDFADHARASRVVRLQRRTPQPALHDVRAARPACASSTSHTRVASGVDASSAARRASSASSSTPTGTSTTGNALGSDPRRPSCAHFRLDGGCCNGSIARKRRLYSSVRSAASCALRTMVERDRDDGLAAYACFHDLIAEQTADDRDAAQSRKTVRPCARSGRRSGRPASPSVRSAPCASRRRVC